MFRLYKEIYKEKGRKTFGGTELILLYLLMMSICNQKSIWCGDLRLEDGCGPAKGSAERGRVL